MNYDQNNPYNQSQQNDSYIQPHQNNPYAQPAQNNPYNQPQNNPYGQPQYNPYGQYNPYVQPIQPTRPQSSIALAVLSFIFALIGPIIAGVGFGIATNGEKEGIYIIGFAMILGLLAFIFGIIGLVKGIKSRRVGGIVFASIGLAIAIIDFFVFSAFLIEATDHINHLYDYYDSYYYY